MVLRLTVFFNYLTVCLKLFYVCGIIHSNIANKCINTLVYPKFYLMSGRACFP